MRNVNTRNREAAEELIPAGAHVVELDVTDESSVEAAVSEAAKLAGSIDVVINNAGVGSSGVFEAFTSDDWQTSFDINVFGMQRVTRAALPYMRAQGSGLLIFLSSVAGRIAFPFFGPYNAAKFAVEGLAETCRADLSMFGIETCVIEPGPFPTNFIDSLMPAGDDSNDQLRSDDPRYAELINATQGMIQGFEAAMGANPDQDPQIVADAIVALIDMPAGERPFRTVVDNMGMADAVTPLNQGANSVAEGLYSAFGMADLLTLATDK
jgi:NAD(P)-dependent dehydrogenase (short-subunit alcohol dehydrogenase family)